MSYFPTFRDTKLHIPPGTWQWCGSVAPRSFNPLGAFTSAASAASYVAGAAYDGLLGAATTPSTSSTAHAGGKGISVEED